MVQHNGVSLALSVEMYEEARRRAQLLAAARRRLAESGGYLAIGEVTQAVELSRSQVYLLIAQQRFPSPALKSEAGQPRMVRWLASDVAAWLEARRSTP
jgi:predicted DNA-binding transcriptional regulator AlpA